MALLGHKQPTPFNALSDIPWDWCYDVYEKKMIISTQNYIVKLKKDGHLITPWYYQTSDGLRWAVALVLQDEAGSIHVNIVICAGYKKVSTYLRKHLQGGNQSYILKSMIAGPRKNMELHT